MRICTWRGPDSSNSRGWSSIAESGCTVVAPEDEQSILARVIPTNLLAPGATLPEVHPPADLILYSGSLSPDSSIAHPSNWLSSGREALDSACENLIRNADRTSRICFQPHCRHVLNDVPSTLRFLDDHADDRFSIAINPPLLIEQSMMKSLEDHLVRIFQSLGPCAGYVILDDPPQTPGWAAAPKHQPDDFPRDLIRRLIDEHVEDHVAVVVAREGLRGYFA